MKYAITVIDDSLDSILGRSDDKTEIVIRRRTVVDFEVVSKDAEIKHLKERIRKLRKAIEPVIESHCLNAMHRVDQMCPICVDYKILAERR